MESVAARGAVQVARAELTAPALALCAPAAVTSARNSESLQPLRGPIEPPIGTPTPPTPASVAGEPRCTEAARLAVEGLRVGDARWFLCPPKDEPVPLAFYGTVLGRTTYYEVRQPACSMQTLHTLLSHCEGIVALQLPETALHEFTWRLLMDQCTGLECLRLPCRTGLAHAQVEDLLRRVAPRLQALALGGRPDVFKSPQLGPLAVPYIKRMLKLTYLDIADGGVGWQPSTGEVRAMLANKRLRGFCMAGHWRADCAALLQHHALRDLECLDLQHCKPQKGWFAEPVKRLAAAVMQLRALRIVQLPAMTTLANDAQQVNTLRAWMAGRDMQFARWDNAPPYIMHDAAHRAELGRIDALAPEARLRALAQLDPSFVECGRWLPMPAAAWEFMELSKKGSVYILSELAALRGLGYTAEVISYAMEVVPTCPAYRFRWELTGGVTYCVTVMPTALDVALERLPVAGETARLGHMLPLHWQDPASTATYLVRASRFRAAKVA